MQLPLEDHVVSVKLIENKGTKRFIPLCRNAKRFCNLLGRKTLSSKNLDLITPLGFTVDCYHEKLGKLYLIKRPR